MGLLWPLLPAAPDSGQMLCGALEITGFLAQHDSLEPLGPARAAQAATLPRAVFISIMSFAYYRQPAKC